MRCFRVLSHLPALLALASLAGFAACSQQSTVGPAAVAGDELSGPESVPLEQPTGPSFTILDGARGGSPGFYFLPPLVAKPTYSGIFDGSLSAIVEVCELTGTVCGPVVATLNSTVQLSQEAYQATWETRGAGLDPAKTYRIRVLVGTQELGYADADIVETASQARQVDQSQFVAVVMGRRVRIRFRIEMGALNPSTVSGRKYEDLDADGTDDGGTDPGLEDWTIRAYADSDEDGVLDTAELDAGAAATATTDANGAYQLTLLPGKYLVCEVRQSASGWFQRVPTGNSICLAGASGDTDLAVAGYAVTLAADADETGRDFGNYRRGTVSGRKFHDLDGDGTDDGGTDPGLEGWVINAYRENGSLASFDLTDANGEYVVEFLNPALYFVCETPQAGWTQTAPANTLCDTFGGQSPGGYDVLITSGSTNPGYDFGNHQP